MNMRAARIGRIVCVLSALALVTGSVTVHAMTLSFERTWGGSASESGEGVAVAPDGSVYLTGQTSSFGTGVADGDLDIFLIKYSADGGILWQRTYGVARPEPFRVANEFAMDVEVGPDGSVYVAGELDARVLLVKFDPDGNVIWERIWGEGGESPRGMAIGGDGSIYLVGFTFFFGAGQGDAFVLKYAPDGTILMQKTWGGTNFDIADDVAVAADGSIYVAGDGNSFFANDAFLVKFASDGTVIWERDWRDGTIQDFSAAQGVALGPDGSVYLTGRASITGFPQRAFLVKFTPAGGIIWERTWDARDSAGASGIAVAPDGNIYITGNTTFGLEGSDAFVVNFLPDGRVQQAATWGSSASVESAQAIVVAPGGSLYVAAVTFGPPRYRFRQASKKEVTPAAFLGNPTGTVTTPAGTVGDPNGIVLIPEGRESYAGASDAVLLRIAP